MFGGYVLRIFLLVVLEIIFVRCLIPPSDTLSVRYVDNKMIERKRKDTIEMCQLFERERLQKIHPKFRRKRDLDLGEHNFIGVPPMREKDIERVEKIVDKLYDDMMGEKPVPYRHREKTTTEAVIQKLFNESNRRFDFAPAFMVGPGNETTKFKVPLPETIPQPWIKNWKHGIVPYYIDSRTYDCGLANQIMTAFDYFERATCIRLQRLREKPMDQQSMENVEWVYITNPMGIKQCVHSNERIPNKGVQMIVFGYDCMSTGEIVHEVMHILGFAHEHTRPDRDRYVSVIWDNIKPGYKKYFEVRKLDYEPKLPYDYASVLHYPPRAFSKNGKITVAAKTPVKLGQREGLSETDVEKVALIFGTECVERNKEYLLTTCPSVVKSKTKPAPVSKDDIKKYFKDRLWPLGVINYKLHNEVEFSAEEKENIRSVIRHIEKETCIQFRDANEQEEGEEQQGEKQQQKEENKSDDNKKEMEKTTNKPTTTNQPEPEPTNKPPPTEEDSNSVESSSSDEIVEAAKLNADGENVVINKKEDEGKVAEIIDDDGKTENPEATKIRRKRDAPVNSRRHANSVLVLKRSVEPGCKCPTPGRSSGEATLELNADCFNSVNDLLHFFVHVLGLDHQHNMHDRDDFLHIVWDDLTPAVHDEMTEKLPPEAAVGFTYDYQSVMHYPWLQIKNGVTSIMFPIWNDGWAMGHWQGLSFTDVQKLNTLYIEQCQEREKHEKDS